MIEEAPLCLPPKPLSAAPSQTLPDGSIDCHFHVFAAGAPLASPRSYTPQICTLDDWQSLAASVNISRGVLVQPSVYGRDNSVLLHSIARDPMNLRGIVVIDPETPLAEIDRLDRAGVRGVRINTRNKGGLTFSAIDSLAGSIADFGWSLQFQVNPGQLQELVPVAKTISGPIVIDHLGFISLGTNTAHHLQDLQRLLDTGTAFVKLSAPYRLTSDRAFDGFGKALATLIASHPERLLWGSDWPHTELFEHMPDDADLVERMLAWMGSAALVQTVMVDTPESLFFAR